VGPPVCVLIALASYRLLDRQSIGSFRITDFDLSGAALGTGGMLLLIYGLVRAPQDGWGSARTIGELAGAAIVLALFALNEARVRHPLVPAAIFRVKGLAAADAAQMMGIAGFYSVFFFVTLYMQDVLGFSAFRAGLAYVPVALMVGVSAGAGAALVVPRIGTRSVIVSGAVIAAGGVLWVSMLPLPGFYFTDLFPGLLIMAFGLGWVFIGTTTAANAGVPPSLAGLAGALITASIQVGGALGLAIFSAVSTARTSALLAAGAARPVALAAGFHRALLLAAIFVFAAAVIGLRAAQTRGEQSAEITDVAESTESVEADGATVTDPAAAGSASAQLMLEAEEF